jgi:hypothetical protein
MRYIKTFESFYNEDDMAREIAMVLDPATVERFEFDPKWKDTSMFRAYEVDHDVDTDALENLSVYMKDEHNLHFTYIEGTDKLIILTEKPLKETCIEWLNTNYSGLEAVDSQEYQGSVLYRYEPKDNILFYDKKNRKVWVRDDLIWSFFEDYFGLDRQEIKGITEEWLSEAYNLKGITTGYFTRRHGERLSEAYNLK